MRSVKAYTASFGHGVYNCLSERMDIASKIMIYMTLLTIFYSIFRIMPLHELGNGTVNLSQMFWYLVVTELVLISVQGNEREFGRQIGEGQLTVLMQRPGAMLGHWLARIAGTVLTNLAVMSVVVLTVVRVVFGRDVPIMMWQWPFLFLSIGLSCLIFLMLGYCVGMLEIFGPYSRSCSWIVNKLIFTFGGLFFPVVFYPVLMQKFVHFTPAPAILFVPGSFMLGLDAAGVLKGLAEQMVWLVLTTFLALALQRWLMRYVLANGD